MKKNGFTLVEISVVTMLLGLLASLGTLAVMKSIANARIKQADTELAMISTAALQLAWDTGRWPNGRDRTTGGSEEEWDLSAKGCGLIDSDGIFGSWKGPYYEGEIQDPWGNNYFFDPDYRINGVDHVVVGSFGPNGRGRNQYDSDDIYVLLDD